MIYKVFSLFAYTGSAEYIPQVFKGKSPSLEDYLNYLSDADWEITQILPPFNFFYKIVCVKRNESHQISERAKKH